MYENIYFSNEIKSLNIIYGFKYFWIFFLLDFSFGYSEFINRKIMFSSWKKVYFIINHKINHFPAYQHS